MITVLATEPVTGSKFSTIQVSVMGTDTIMTMTNHLLTRILCDRSSNVIIGAGNGHTLPNCKQPVVSSKAKWQGFSWTIVLNGPQVI